MSIAFHVEQVALDKLRPHPQNYRHHPDDQVAQIAASIKAHGIYKNIVVANDYTILAGHGTVLACRSLGMETVPVKKVDCDPFSAQGIKIVVGDNELSNMADDDDRLKAELLKTLSETNDLAGTGYDEQQILALLMVTRPQSEIADYDEAAEWLGMPGYESGASPWKLVVNFRSEDEMKAFMEERGLTRFWRKGQTVTMRWPPERMDEKMASLRSKWFGTDDAEEAK